MDNTQDTVWISARGKAYSEPESGRVEYIRAETIRECLGRSPGRVWQLLVQSARRTPGYSQTGMARLRELVEANRDE